MQVAKHPICYVVGSSGELPCSGLSFSVQKEDYVIAADGGYQTLLMLGIRIDLLIGDFDSLDEQLIRLDKQMQNSVIRLPKEKDVTDTFAAVEHGLQKGCREFHIYGGTGGSMRHTYANIQLLTMLADCGARGYLHGAYETMTVIKNDSMAFPKAREGYLSVFALGGQAQGITLENVKYPLNNSSMSDIFPIGVSNEFQSRPAKVSVSNGSLLLIYESLRD